MNLFNRTERKRTTMPAVLTQPENPVNYNSVLDYLVGLSGGEYQKITKVTDIYREANKKAADVLGVKDVPITKLKQDKPTDEEIEQGLDDALNADHLDFLDDDEPKVFPPAKEQEPSKKTKIKIQE